MAGISFSTFQLIIARQEPQKMSLDLVFSDSISDFEYEGTYYKIELEVIDDNFYWIYSNFGKSLPHSDVVINSQSKKLENNPRATNQIEPTKQVFAVYDKSTAVFYISNIKKKSFFENFLNKKTRQEVIIKDRYKTAKEFLATIKSVESIALTSLPRDMLRKESDIFKGIDNIFGYDKPGRFYLEGHFNMPLTERIKKKIQGLIKEREEGVIKSLICIGKNNKGIPEIFNAEKFMNKIYISLDKDDNGFFPKQQVKENIIQRLKEI